MDHDEQAQPEQPDGTDASARASTEDQTATPVAPDAPPSGPPAAGAVAVPAAAAAPPTNRRPTLGMVLAAVVLAGVGFLGGLFVGRSIGPSHHGPFPGWSRQAPAFPNGGNGPWWEGAERGGIGGGWAPGAPNDGGMGPGGSSGS